MESKTTLSPGINSSPISTWSADHLGPDFERQEGVPSTQAPHRRQALHRGHRVHRPTGTASSRSNVKGTARRCEFKTPKQAGVLAKTNAGVLAEINKICKDQKM